MVNYFAVHHSQSKANVALTKTQLKFLRSLAHQLSPVVWIGQNGLTEAVIAEFEQALLHHELIKCSVRIGDKESRLNCINSLLETSDAVLVQSIGNTAVVYKANPEKPQISLPK